jgi:hypothetical protein
MITRVHGGHIWQEGDQTETLPHRPDAYFTLASMTGSTSGRHTGTLLSRWLLVRSSPILRPTKPAGSSDEL